MSVDYGFESTDEVQYDKQGLPIGIYKVMCISEEQDVKEDVDRGVVIELEILDGDHKGSKGKVWLLTKHENAQTRNIAMQNIKRIADATGSPVAATAPIKGRVFTVDVQQQKKNPDYTEVKRWLPEDFASEDVPF